MPLIKSRSKKAQSKNIETEMDAGKPQKQAIAISYDIMRRAKKNKKAQGGLSNPESEKDLMESKSMVSRPNDKEDRGHVLFDGDAERIDPLKLEMRENLQSDNLGRRQLDDEDSDADDIVSRIMRKMRRK